MVTITRDLDTGDAADFVIPAEDEWTLGWALNTSSETMSSDSTIEQSGSIQIKIEAAGATYLAGLTASGLAALALIVSQ